MWEDIKKQHTALAFNEKKISWYVQKQFQNNSPKQHYIKQGQNACTFIKGTETSSSKLNLVDKIEDITNNETEDKDITIHTILSNLKNNKNYLDFWLSKQRNEITQIHISIRQTADFQTTRKSWHNFTIHFLFPKSFNHSS